MHIRRTGSRARRIRRRLWNLIVPTLLGLLVGLALSQLLPREYVATATLAATLNPASTDSGDRLRAVSDQLLSDSALQQVAREERLDATGPADGVAAEIRSQTTVSLAPDPDTYLVSYTASTPQLAQRVANRIAQVFVDQQTPRDAQGGVASASLARQVELSRDKLSAAEAGLREARASSQGSADQAAPGRQAIANLRKRLAADTQSLSAERERVTALDRQIDAAQREAAEASAARYRERVNALERQLAEMRKQYTSQHPDVQRRELELAQARDDERAALATAGQTPLSDPALKPLATERDQARQRVQELEAAVTRTEAELKRSEGRVKDDRVVGQRVASASRAYEAAKAEHERLDNQYQQALRDESARQGQTGQRAALLAAASQPAAPSSPNLTLVLAGSLLGGLLLGLAWAASRQLLEPSFDDGRLLEAKYGKPVLAEIPHI
jgi:uncharacterized protein involved in exopolysaccharide biosynthesis